MDQWLQEHLVCPRHHGTLTVQDDLLVCEAGDTFPLVHGVPVMLLPEVEDTLWVATRSRERARRRGELTDNDPFFTDTIGLDEEQRSEVKKRMNRLEQEPIDPVVSGLVAATGGHLYKEICGRLDTYPIPALRLPGGSGAFLEVGCNWGRWCSAAARKGYRVVGIDPSLGAILAGQRVSKKLGLTSCFVVGDARYLPFAPASFDVVFSYSVLQHFSKPSAVEALREAARTLKPGGCSLIQMPNAFGIRSLYHQWKRGFREPAAFEVRYWTPAELVKAFTELIGPTELSVDGYFGLGIQPNDAKLLPLKHRAVIYSSEILRRMAKLFSPMRKVADSLYLRSTRQPGHV
jgi:SAM-dependent methyltransferase/uncharacterized protein YbaR (Trm112 family)